MTSKIQTQFTPLKSNPNGVGVTRLTEDGPEISGDGDTFSATMRTIDLAQQRLVCGHLERMSPERGAEALRASQEISEVVRRVIG